MKEGDNFFSAKKLKNGKKLEKMKNYGKNVKNMKKKNKMEKKE